MISDQQQKRIDKLVTDEFYLIGLNDKTDTYEDSEILMTGSTKNVYKINLSNNGSMVCNCPDSSSHAKKHGVVCKHICFIYLKICKSDDMTFFEKKKLTTLDISKLKLRTEMVSKTATAQKYYNKYMKQTKGDTELNFDEAVREIEDLDELECPICFDGMKDDLKFCPECSNPIHKKCVEKWLESNNTCVYCRSDIWKNYGSAKSKKISQDSSQYQYVNLNK